VMGMRHATDPDHVIAVTTIVSRERRVTAAARIGIVWGLGHTMTVLAVGAAIIVFKLAVPPRLGLAMEFAVAIVLILLGLSVTTQLVRRIALRCAAPLARPPERFAARSVGGASSDAAALALVVHSHSHTHGGVSHRHPHVHAHVHGGAGEDGAEEDAAHHDHALPQYAATSMAAQRPLLRSFGVGLVHGLAGSAAIALLVLSAIPQPLWATLYLVVFCIGTIVGMGLITTAIATPFMFGSLSTARFHQLFVTGAGLLSFGFGVLMAYQIGVVDGLFAAVVIWTPH
jgi:hypothetical protein